MSILTRILVDLGDLTDEQLERGGNHVQPIEASETVLGTLTGSARPLFALAHEYQKQSRKLLYHGLYEMDRKDADPVLMEARELDSLSDITRDIAWLEARREIGKPAWESGSIGLRENWTLVGAKDDDEGPSIKLAAIGISDLLQSIFKAAAPAPDPAPKPPGGGKPH